MLDKRQFYIDGKWVAPATPDDLEVINPATEEPCAVISLGAAADVDRAVTAARAAFETFAQTSSADRLGLLRTLQEIYDRRYDELAATISLEMGAPIDMAKRAQAATGKRHIATIIDSLEHFEWERANASGKTVVRLEPIGVCAMITPWNWPINQITAKLMPAIATGCPAVLKPSEIAPLSGMLFMEMIDEAGFPPGVVNLVNGDGIGVGALLSGHPGVDMISFTGSTRAGVAVSKNAADTVKRVTLELGGKSPNLIFADTDVNAAVARGVGACFNNTGQSCNAPTRMLVEESAYAQAVEVARAVGETATVGEPSAAGPHIGPLVSAAQFDKVQGLIQSGIDEGARLLLGGTGRPEGFNRGYFVRPTVFADTTAEMRIVREEIFGPVLSMMPFRDEDEAIALANDTPYGLASYVQTGSPERARRVANRIRAGMVQINGAAHSPDTPFGGYNQSGNGREFGAYGMMEYLEHKSISGP